MVIMELSEKIPSTLAPGDGETPDSILVVLLRKYMDGVELPPAKRERFDRLLLWMNRYVETGAPVPDHWIKEAFAVIDGGRRGQDGPVRV